MGDQATVTLTEFSSGQIGLRLSGRLTESNADDFREQLTRFIRPGHDVVLDFTDVSFLTSSGLAVICWLARRCEVSGHRLKVVGATGIVHRVLVVTGLDGYLT